VKETNSGESSRTLSTTIQPSKVIVSAVILSEEDYQVSTSVIKRNYYVKLSKRSGLPIKVLFKLVLLVLGI